jgi:ATP synthase protein I
MTLSPKKSDAAADRIRRGAERIHKARKSPRSSPLRGLGTFGMIGWSVAVPIVGGAFLGVWLDRVAPQTFSWTVLLILTGTVIGAVIAWQWVGRESGPE